MSSQVRILLSPQGRPSLKRGPTFLKPAWTRVRPRKGFGGHAGVAQLVERQPSKL